MNFEVRAALWKIFVRGLWAAPFFIVGFLMLESEHIGFAFYGVAFLVVGSIIVAFPVAALAATSFMSLLWPSESAPPPPMYGIPESHAKQGHFEQAIREYEEIARKYPGEIKPYVDMLDIAIVRLSDPDRGRRIYDEGMARLRDADRREALTRMYTAISSRLTRPGRRPPSGPGGDAQ